MTEYTTCTIPVGFVCIPMDEYVNMKDSAHASMTSLREELARKSTQVVERDATIAKLKETLEDYRKELKAQSFLLFEAREKLRCCDEQRHALLDELDEAEKTEDHLHKLLDHALIEINATRNKIKDIDPEAFEEWMDNLPDLWEAMNKAIPLEEDEGKEGTDAVPEEET